MRIFITGASGFIGIHLARRLNQTEHELNCLVRKTSRTDELSTLRASLIEGDVTDRTSVRQGMKGCDWVVNLANLYSLWEPEKRDYARVNIEGTRNVMECALDIGISKVVHVSTVAVYGKPADCPFTERSTVGPIRFSEYARTKYEGERIAWELHEKRGLPLVVVYPGAVVGPGDPKATGRYVRDIIHKRLPATVFPNSVLTFVHVRDVAEVIVRTLEKQGNIGEKYFAGKDRLPFREVNRMINELSGVALPKICLPDSMAFTNAALLTCLAGLIKKPPPWGMSMDQIRTMKVGFSFDGSKAERELGITYTPIRTALQEGIAAYQMPDMKTHADGKV